MPPPLTAPGYQYPITQIELNFIVKSLQDYYQIAREEQIRSLFDGMAQKNMGFFTAKGDQAKDLVRSLRKPSIDSLSVTLGPMLNSTINRAVSNKYEVGGVLIKVATEALKYGAGLIPVPGLNSAVKYGVGYAGGLAGEEAHERALQDNSNVLNSRTGMESEKLYLNDTDIKDTVVKSMEDFMSVCRYIRTMPAEGSQLTFDEAVALPASTFQVQKAASSLNVSLWDTSKYVEGMRQRLDQINTISEGYVNSIRTQFPTYVTNILNRAYSDAREARMKDPKSSVTCPLDMYPPLMATTANAGGASQLGAYLSHAVLLGCWNSYHPGTSATPSTARVWQADASTKTCSKCNTEFTMFNRRHHCRKCGQIFCNNCCPERYRGAIIQRECLYCSPI